MKNFLLRSFTGIIYAGLICGSVLYGGWWFIALFSLFAIAALNEFYSLSNAATGGENVITLVEDVTGGLILVVGLGCVNIDLLSPFTTRILGGTFFTVYLLYMTIRLVTQLYSQESSPLTNLAYSYMGQLYIALPLGLMSMYYTLPDGKILLLAMFIMIWLSDTGAFLVGSMIGKHKLFPRISPGKTWEGFCGALFFALLSAFVMKYVFGDYFESISIYGLCGFSIVVCVFSTWGDLVESLIKRTLGVKDSGNILPGHGGILDRIDSLLLVIPSSLVYLITITLYS